MPLLLRSETSPQTFCSRLSSELGKPISEIVALHVKGFGPLFTDEDAIFPKAALEKLFEADFVVFDGDDFSELNYSRSLRDYLTKKSKKSKRLLAFKFEDEVESHFIPSWSKCPLPYEDEMVELSYISVSRNDAMSDRRLFDINAAEIFVSTSLKNENDDSNERIPRIQEDFFKSLTQSQMTYVALGVWAVMEMKKVGPNLRVLCWGGSLVVGCECLMQSILFSLKGNLIAWTYIHAKRRHPSTGNVQEGVLLNVKHPMISLLEKE
jgi:hypothetical protein